MFITVTERETQAGLALHTLELSHEPNIRLSVGDRFVRRSNNTVETVVRIYRPWQDSVIVVTCNAESYVVTTWDADSILQLIEDGALTKEQFTTEINFMQKVDV